MKSSLLSSTKFRSTPTLAVNFKTYVKVCNRYLWCPLCQAQWDRCNQHSYQIWKYLRLITVFVTRVTRRVSHVEQELPTLPEHLSSSSVVSGVHVDRSLVFCV